jgi:hypothetical protein
MKTIVVTPAFCKSEMLKHSMANFYEYQKGNFEHWILLNHYPVNKEKNNQEIIEITKDKLFRYTYNEEFENVWLH